MVKIPCNDAIEFALPVLTAFYGGSSQVCRCVSVQPLFAEHRKEGGEESESETREEDGLNLDYPAGRACPLRRWRSRGRRVVSEAGVIDLVQNNTEEGCGYVVRILLEVGLDLYYEGGSDGREQTSLESSSSARVRPNSGCETHEYQGGVQILVVFLHELLVVSISLFAVALKEPSSVILLRGLRSLSPAARI